MEWRRFTTKYNNQFRKKFVYAIFGFRFLIACLVITIALTFFNMVRHTQTNPKHANLYTNAHHTPAIANPNLNHHSNYTLSPIAKSNHFGAFITGIDICTDNNPKLISQLVKDIYKYKFVVLKKQCTDHNYLIPPLTLETFGAEFGETSLYYLRSPADPEGTNITVLSNDPTKGIVGRGATMWHVDGMWDIAPKSHCLQHIVKIPNFGGRTELVDSAELLRFIKEKDSEFYDELHTLYVTYYNPTLEFYFIYPLVAVHTVTNEEYLILNLKGKPMNIRHIIRVDDKSWVESLPAAYIRGVKVVKFKKKRHVNDGRIRIYRPKQSANVRDRIAYFIDEAKDDSNVFYQTEYEYGDLLVRDNLLMLHCGDPTTVMPVDHVGLRVMWRLCVNGKDYPVPTL